jgi:DNA invertase Pin-like site-specific DNA recombinase
MELSSKVDGGTPDSPPKRKMLFAPLIRVSTEEQKKRGESLRVQKEQLTRAIEALGGEVYHWYAGQEHATPDSERRILEQLMRDAQAGKFDAVIVADLSRWSRDNEKSKNYTKILQKSGVRFFEGTMEIDLFNPSHSLVLGMGVEIQEFFANQQAYKSILSRISRAKRGWPACGKLPYGRTWNKLTKVWDIDKEKQAKVKEIARVYLTGDYSWEELGRMFGMNPANLGKTICYHCGEEWKQRFRSKRCNIDETVVTKVPRLLKEETILAFRKKSEQRNSWDKKGQKHPYLFARLIFDMDTGNSLIGGCNSMGRRYYKQYCGSPNRYRANADVLEKAVLEELYVALGSKVNLHKAIFDGNPVGKVADKIQGDLKSKRDELKLVEVRIENYLTAIGTSIDVPALIDRIKLKLEDLEARFNGLADQITALEYQLNTLPTDEEIEAKRDKWAGLLNAQLASSLDSGVPLLELPFEHQKKIIRLFFGGKDELGRRYGIYVKNLGGDPRHYRFEAYGKLGKVFGWIEAKTGGYFSDSTCDLILKDDEELAKGISKVILDGEPLIFGAYSEDKDHMLSKGKGRDHQAQGNRPNQPAPATSHKPASDPWRDSIWAFPPLPAPGPPGSR